MHTNSNTVVSDNLPIYFIWFGSDVPPKYFGNLLRAADTNKSRDIILVYSEEHLPEDNRKNIDSIESVKINEIKERVELKRNSETQNLFKIDVYDMELNKQDRRIYNLYKQMFMQNTFLEKSFPFCCASDVIRLPLLNIIGGVYFDMDTEIIGEIGDIETKNGFGFCHSFNDAVIEGREISQTVPGNMLIKSNAKNNRFNSIMKAYFSRILDEIKNPNFTQMLETDPVSDLYEHTGYRWHSKVNDETKQQALKQIISNYGINVSQAIKLKMAAGEGYELDYNNPDDLKKLGLDEQDYGLSNKLENLSLEQLESSQEKGR